MAHPLDPLFRRPGAPLPGTGAPPRGLFIDRWGTLLEPPSRGYCTRFEQASFTPDSLDVLFRAVQAGWKIYLLGNEPAVWEGRLAASTWHKFEGELLSHMASLGVPVQHDYACLVHPEGKGEQRGDSVFQLPNTGALYHATQNDGIELKESWVIGDSTLELVAGWRGGCRLAGVKSGQGLGDAEFQVEPDFMADNLAGALVEILSGEPVQRA